MSYFRVDYTLVWDNNTQVLHPPECTIIFHDSIWDDSGYREYKTEEDINYMDHIVDSTTSFWRSENCRVSFGDYDLNDFDDVWKVGYCNKTDGCSEKLPYDMLQDFKNISVGVKNVRRYCST